MDHYYYYYHSSLGRIVLATILLHLAFHGGSLVDASHDIYPEWQSVEAEAEIVHHVHRTGYHFQPPKNWINDPNGPMYYNGIYHLFYQYNPKGSVWGNIVWAHSVSTDLVNWRSLPPAIYPSKPFDVNGCWSGSATVRPDGQPVILYTGLNPKNTQVQNYAIPANLSDPYLRDWIKPDDNPLVVPTPDINASQFRDPTTAWFHNGHWHIVVGSRRELRGMAYLYRSRDFLHWQKAKHPLHSSPGTGMWECPDFYPVQRDGVHGVDTSSDEPSVKHVLKVSLDLTRYEYYTIGRYDPKKDKYIPDDTSDDGWGGLRYDYGNYYASKTFYDAGKKRRILLGWANESDTPANDVKKGWAGIQLIPRSVWLHSNGKQLMQWPIHEIESLRGETVLMKDVNLETRQKVEVKGVTASQADVEVVFSFSSLDAAEPFDSSWVNAEDLCGLKGADVPGGVGPFGLFTLASDKMEEFTPVFFRIFKAPDKHVVLMCSDAKSSSLQSGLYKPSFAGFVDADLTDNELSLRSLIDHSVVESFGEGGKTCITSRVYPTLAIEDKARLFVFNNGEVKVRVEKLDAWSMKRPVMNVALQI